MGKNSLNERDANSPRADARNASSTGEIAAESGSALLALLNAVRLVRAHKALVLTVTLAGAAVTAGVSFLVPDTYTAVAMIMPPQQAQSSSSMLLGQLGALSGVANLGLKTPSDLYVGLLGSRTIADHLIDRFRLKDVFSVKSYVQARRQLEKRRTIVSGRDSLIKITVEDTEPKRAADIANAFVSELETVNAGLASDEARQRRNFLERRTADEKAALNAAEDGMRAMQSRTGLIHIDGQAQVAIAAAAQLRAQITAGEVALQRLSNGATDQNPEVIRIRSELTELRSQLRKVETAAAANGDPLLSATALPNAGIEYLRSIRELKYHEALYELLSRQYEAARLDEAKAAPPIGVVDYAVPADRKSGPPRLLLGILSVAGCALLGCILAGAVDRIDRLRAAGPSTENAARAARVS